MERFRFLINLRGMANIFKRPEIAIEKNNIPIGADEIVIEKNDPQFDSKNNTSYRNVKKFSISGCYPEIERFKECQNEGEFVCNRSI